MEDDINNRAVEGNREEEPQKKSNKKKFNTKTKYLDCFDEAQKRDVRKFIKKQEDVDDPKQNPFERRRFPSHLKLQH